MNTPTTAKRSRKTETSRLPSEAIHAVMVVPMLAPMMMAVAWKSVKMPALTRPTTMTVVADELWMIIVTAAPMPTPAKRLPAVLLSILLSSPWARRDILSDMISMPARKAPNPPRSSIMVSKTSITGIVFLLLFLR